MHQWNIFRADMYGRSGSHHQSGEPSEPHHIGIRNKFLLTPVLPTRATMMPWTFDHSCRPAEAILSHCMQITPKKSVDVHCHQARSQEPNWPRKSCFDVHWPWGSTRSPGYYRFRSGALPFMALNELFLLHPTELGSSAAALRNLHVPCACFHGLSHKEDLMQAAERIPFFTTKTTMTIPISSRTLVQMITSLRRVYTVCKDRYTINGSWFEVDEVSTNVKFLNCLTP